SMSVADFRRRSPRRGCQSVVGKYANTMQPAWTGGGAIYPDQRKSYDHGCPEETHLQAASRQAAESPAPEAPPEHLLRPLRRGDPAPLHLLQLRLAQHPGP